MKIKASPKDSLFKSLVDGESGATLNVHAEFTYDAKDGDYLQFVSPIPVAVHQAFTTTADPLKSMRDELDGPGYKTSGSGLSGEIPRGRWYLVNWNLDVKRENKQRDQLEASLAELNRTLEQQFTASGSTDLQPFPAEVVKQLLTLPYFKDIEFTASEADEMVADFQAMYQKIVADNLYTVYKEGIDNGTFRGDRIDGLTQIDPSFYKPIAAYPWAKTEIDDYLSRPTGFFSRLFKP